MTVVRRHTGPAPRHPVAVVPTDPSRRGALVRVRGWEIAVADPIAQVVTADGMAERAEQLGWAVEPDARPSGLPFTDGLVGFITDDHAPAAMGLPPVDVRPGPAPLPDLWFGEYAHAAALSPDRVWWVAGRTEQDCQAAADMIEEAAARPRRTELSRPADRPLHAWPTIDRTDHAAAVRQIQDWIQAGDVYQVNLTLHVAAPWEGTPRQLAYSLFGANPHAEHAAFLHAPGATVASVSPETFLRIDGRVARVRPIKGTRRRSTDPARDQALAEQLAGAVKDSAEHVMIVDLERNDLGRISRVGTVSVPQLMVLEPHPTVWHLTSTVEGTIRDDIDLGGVVEALFPCGSVTGAPKHMAVSRIRGLEPWRRGVYCGAIGVIGQGLVDLSVAIRTTVMHSGQAWYGTGGGIVADSDPDGEWDEAMAKAAAFFTATGTLPPE
ncbi:anthranilate synthase component I family protein [Euzebya tangerina]|uniref:anthranilate synthase component I family protein n=1 Tax=Euzebya tangerina TaxID=591198 RepID=UPI000E31FE41|nr:anthranilate synthase component I family protein [Euzebya tangerina]